MTRPIPRTALLGDLVVAAFDGAARLSSDPHEVSRLATLVVKHLLRRGGLWGRLEAAGAQLAE